MTKENIVTKLAKELADNVYWWLGAKGIWMTEEQEKRKGELVAVFEDLTVGYLSEAKCHTYEENYEFAFRLFDYAEDFLDIIGIGVDDVPNDDREDAYSAIICGEDYGWLHELFVESINKYKI